MALYLGKEKVGVTIKVGTSAGGEVTSGVKYATGTEVTTPDGMLYLPPIDFTPSKILVWNIQENFADESAGDVLYFYSGIMLLAVYDPSNDIWYSQIAGANSSEVYLSNASISIDGDDQPENAPHAGQAVTYEDGAYVYRIARGDGSAYGDTLFNYAIYE